MTLTLKQQEHLNRVRERNRLRGNYGKKLYCGNNGMCPNDWPRGANRPGPEKCCCCAYARWF